MCQTFGTCKRYVTDELAGDNDSWHNNRQVRLFHPDGLIA